MVQINQRNSIPEKQNQPLQLECLAAQRSLYSKAKTIFILEILLAVPIVVLLSLISAYFPSFLPWFALYGLIVTTIDYLILENVQNNLKKKAAQIQELFDCRVLELDWPFWKIPHRPDPEDIVSEAANYKKKDSDFGSLYNWYPLAIEKLPLDKARIVCQRTNVWYDSSLRHRYTNIIFILLVFFCILILCIGLLQSLNLEKLILGVAIPLSPALYWGIREIRSQRDAASNLDRLKDYAETLIDEIKTDEVAPPIAAMKSRSFQDEIYENRKNNPLILDAIYNVLREKHELQMNKGNEELVEELVKTKDI